MVRKKKNTEDKPRQPSGSGQFHIEFKTEAQGLAWAAFKQHEVLFLTGSPGSGKTFLACAFAVEQILNNEKKWIILTRPIVEAGEKLGFLPGEFEEKVFPYMEPMYDCLDVLLGRHSPWREKVNQAIKIKPLAFMRGNTFQDAVCIFDEAQNATKKQIKMFLSRFGDNSKIIVTGDPAQSDLPGDVALVDVIHRLHGTEGIGFVQFKSQQIVRHPLVAKIMEKLEE